MSDNTWANFGATSSALGAPGASDSRVAQAQQLLNAIGYGPLAVDGILGDNTRAALGRALGMTVVSVDDAVLSALNQKAQTGIKPPTPPKVTGPVNSGLVTPEPFWKQPLFIGVGVAAVLGVLFFFTKNETKVFSGVSEGDSEPSRGRRDIGPHAAPVRRVPAKRKKCQKTPTWDSGEPVEIS